MKQARAYLARNADLLSDRRLAVGTWYDEASGFTYLDITAVLSDRHVAEELGRRYNQVGVYGLECGEFVDTEGGGTPLEGWPAAHNRLPPLAEEP